MGKEGTLNWGNCMSKDKEVEGSWNIQELVSDETELMYIIKCFCCINR